MKEARRGETENRKQQQQKKRATKERGAVVKES
jgi:hypothetical protein